MVSDDQVDAKLPGQVGGGVSGRAAVSRNDHSGAGVRQLLDDCGREAVAIDETVWQTNARLDADHAQPGGEDGGRVDAVGIVVREDGYLVVIGFGSDDSLDGNVDVLEQVRVVGIAAHAGEEVEAQVGVLESAGVHHL